MEETTEGGACVQQIKRYGSGKCEKLLVGVCLHTGL